MSKSATIIAFIAGAAIGSVAAWKIAKSKYDQIIDTEVEERVRSVKEVFSKRYNEKTSTEKADEKETSEPPRYTAEKNNIMEYATELMKRRYSEESDLENTEEACLLDEPVVISPDEFGEDEEYSKITLWYYADKVLTDDNRKKIENIDEIIGRDSLTHFGEYEDDSVFVRNDKRKCYYEILLDEDRYSDILKKYPYEADE